MHLTEFLCGTPVSALKSDVVLLETTRKSQSVRTRQSVFSFVLVCVVGIVYLWGLWDRVDPMVLTLWVGSIIFMTGWRSLVSLRVRKNLSTALAEQLVQNESDLIFTGIAIPLIVGAGHWLLRSTDDGLTILAVTLLCCMYAVGSTINTVAQRRILAFMVILNLGQGVLYFATRGVRVDYAVAVQLLALTFLLLGFAKRFEAMFVELIRSDFEIKSQNKTLQENRLEIEAALKEAVDANKTKSQFFAAASHDLSQPLHAMSMFIDNLKQISHNDERQSDLVVKIENSAEILKQQFDGLLDLSRYDAGGVTVRKKSFDLYALCNLLVESERPSAAKKDLQLILQGTSVTITSDTVLLGRLIGNLLANAIKFTDTGIIELSISEQNGQAMLSVADTGCGLTDADREKIFQDFVQVGNTARNRNKGAGLGLSIVRRIANLLDVKVSVQSEAGFGSVFTLLFPVEEIADDSKHGNLAANSELKFKGSDKKGRAAALDLSGYTFLLVDDDSDILDALQNYIESRGGAAVSADTFEGAKKISREQEIDFVIIDDMLGEERSGLDLARYLSNDIAIRHIIIVTGNVVEKRIEILRSSGFGTYAKPLSPTKLDKIIDNRLDRD